MSDIPKGGRKNTTIAVQNRVRQVVDLLLTGRRRDLIIKEISTEHGLSEVQVEMDIAKAYEIIRANAAISNAETIDKHIAMYYTNYEIALSLGDVKAANQALQFLEKLRGLHKPETQINIQQNTVKLDNLSVDDLLKIVNNDNLNKDSVVDKTIINVSTEDNKNTES